MVEACAKSLSQITGQQHAIAPETAMELARKLSPEARHEVIRVAADSGVKGMGAAAAEMEAPPPSMHDLRLIALAQAIPFLG